MEEEKNQDSFVREIQREREREKGESKRNALACPYVRTQRGGASASEALCNLGVNLALKGDGELMQGCQARQSVRPRRGLLRGCGDEGGKTMAGCDGRCSGSTLVLQLPWPRGWVGGGGGEGG